MRRHCSAQKWAASDANSLAMPASMSERWPASFIIAARRVSRRAASSCVAMSASLNWIAWCWAIGLPNVLRSREYFSASSSARWALPTPRAAAVPRPTPSPPILSRLHHLRDAPAEAGLLAAEDVPGRAAVAVEDELGRLDALVAELLDLRRDVETGVLARPLRGARLLLGDEARHAAVARLGARIGLDEHEDERREQAVRDPHLLAVDLVGVAVDALGRGLDRLHVGAELGLGEAERGADLTGRHAREVLPALLVGAELHEQVRADEVRVDDPRDRDPPARELLDDHRVGRQVEPHPPVLLGDRDAEQTELAHLLDDRLGKLVRRVVVPGVRDDLLVRKLADHLADRLLLVGLVGVGRHQGHGAEQ